MSVLYLPSRSYSLEVNWDDPLNKGLVAWWPFRQNGGDTLRDIAGKNHGTLNGSMTADDWVASPETKSLALDFDGTDDYVRANPVFATGEIVATVSLYFNRSSAAGSVSRTLFSCEADANRFFSIYIDARFATKYVYLHYRNFAGNNVQVLHDVTSALQKWNHVCAIFQNGNYCLFFNGRLENSSASSVTQYTVSNADTFIGNSDLLGVIDNTKITDVRVYNRALNAAEVHDLYVASRRGYPTQFKRRKLIFSTQAAGGGGTSYYNNFLHSIIGAS